MLATLASPLALRALVGLAVAGLVGWGAYALRAAGREACETEHQASMAEHLQRGIVQAQAIARQDAEISEYYERWRTREVQRWHVQVEEVTRDITPDCAQCGLSPDGLRTLNDLRKPGPVAPDPGQPDGRVPAPDADTQPLAPGFRGIPGTGQPHVQRLRGTPQGAGRCDS